MSSARKSIALSFYTFLSRILGLLRDHYMAVSFGSGMLASAFSVAYRLPNMFRNLLAEGTLSQSFMPLYSEEGTKGKDEASAMAGSVLTFLGFLLILFVLAFWVIAPYLLPKLVGGTSEYYNLVIELSLILFFLIMTASLSSIFIAISNSKNKFFVPSLSPIILNLCYLFVFVVIFRLVNDALLRIKILCGGIVTGGLIQLTVQALYVYKNKNGPTFNFNWKHPAIKKIFKLMLPAVVGGGFYQIGLLIDIFLANYIQNTNPGLDAVVSLDYSQRLIQFPTGIIGVALATTTLPALLNSLKIGEKESIPSELSSVFSFCMFLTIPSALGLGIMSRPIIDAIYFGGKWSHQSTEFTVLPLIFYSVAVPFFSLNKILTTSYYAFHDTKTPLKINAVSFTISLGMNLLLMQFLKHTALAMSSAVSSLITFLFLFFSIRKHSIYIPAKNLISSAIKISIPSVILCVWLYIISQVLYSDILGYFSGIELSHENASRIITALGVIPGSIVYFATSYFLKTPGSEVVFSFFSKKK